MFVLRCIVRGSAGNVMSNMCDVALSGLRLREELVNPVNN